MSKPGIGMAGCIDDSMIVQLATGSALKYRSEAQQSFLQLLVSVTAVLPAL